MRILILLFLVFSLNCKFFREQPIGIAFVIADGVKLWDKPSSRSKLISSLNQNTKVNILARKIPDSSDNARIFWYKVSLEKEIGFISYVEELQKKSFISMKEPEIPVTAIITASSLRLRESPTLTSKVLASLPRGEEVEVLLEGTVNQKIDQKYDTWVQVKRKDGQIGYCYKGYIMNTLDIQDDVKPERLNAFVEIKSNNPVYLNRPVGRAVTEADPIHCGYHSIDSYPKKGENVSIIEKAEANGKLYYHIEEIVYGNEETCEAGISGWIESESVIFFEDRFEYTSKKCKQNLSKYDTSFYEFINVHNKSSLDVCKLKIEEIPLLFNQTQEEEKAFYKVNEFQIYMKAGEEFVFLKDYSSPWSSVQLEFKDINADGTYEIFTTDNNRGGQDLGIYTFDGRQFQSIYENHGDHGLDTILEVNPPYLIEKYAEMKYDGAGTLEKKAEKKYKLIDNKLVLQQ